MTSLLEKHVNSETLARVYIYISNIYSNKKEEEKNKLDKANIIERSYIMQESNRHY